MENKYYYTSPSTEILELKSESLICSSGEGADWEN